MDFFEAVEKRRAVRAFSSKSVPQEDLNKVLETAVRAPSAGNRQAYRVVVVQKREVKKEIALACLEQEFITQAPVVLVFVALPEVSAVKYGSRGRTLYSIQDATLAASYAQLAASALGLSTCWVGAFEDDKLARVCKLEKDELPITVIPLGYAAEEPEKTPRRPLEKTVSSL